MNTDRVNWPWSQVRQPHHTSDANNQRLLLDLWGKYFDLKFSTIANSKKQMQRTWRMLPLQRLTLLSQPDSFYAFVSVKHPNWIWSDTLVMQLKCTRSAFARGIKTESICQFRPIFSTHSGVSGQPSRQSSWMGRRCLLNQYSISRFSRKKCEKLHLRLHGKKLGVQEVTVEVRKFNIVGLLMGKLGYKAISDMRKC